MIFGKILLVFLGLFVQEIISMNALVFATSHGAYPTLLIHIVFVIATLIDIGIGFFIGKFLRKKTSGSKVALWIQKTSDRFSLSTKKYRRWIALLLLGNFSFPYINACIAGYLDMPFWESLFFIFIGDLIWYATVWLVVISISSLVKNLFIAFLIIIMIALLVMIAVRKFSGKRV